MRGIPWISSRPSRDLQGGVGSSHGSKVLWGDMSGSQSVTGDWWLVTGDRHRCPAADGRDGERRNASGPEPGPPSATRRRAIHPRAGNVTHREGVVGAERARATDVPARPARPGPAPSVRRVPPRPGARGGPGLGGPAPVPCPHLAGLAPGRSRTCHVPHLAGPVPEPVPLSAGAARPVVRPGPHRPAEACRRGPGNAPSCVRGRRAPLSVPPRSLDRVPCASRAGAAPQASVNGVRGPAGGPSDARIGPWGRP